MEDITYRDRITGALRKEKIYGRFFLESLYGTTLLARLFSLLILPLIAHIPAFSFFYGKKQKRKKSRNKILPFIRNFQIDVEEFADPVERYQSFNDFFTRKLKREARPISSEEKVATFPADGRHLVYPDIGEVEGFYIKGSHFNLSQLVQDRELFERYERGSMVISRLCPTDYHRFHFPCSGVPSPAKLINGPLFSVNPVALRRYLTILSENKRMLTSIDTEQFARVLYIEVGATCVGSIKETFTPGHLYKKGEEKGYFEFGGSCVLLLFEPGVITFDQDLIASSEEYIETYATMGTPLGRCK